MKLLLSGLALLGASMTRFGELIPGGRASGRSPSDFDPRQLRMGIKVETEHTSDRLLAQEIAMDHLVEDPRYYDKLIKAGL
jgi:hypothetical protein